MQLSFSEAQKTDLTSLVELLADDALGKQREDTSEPLNDAYHQAFKHINSDPNNELIVVKTDQKIIGMLHSHLSHTLLIQALGDV